MASDEANSKLRSTRGNDPNKPYSRRRSIVGRVTAAMKDMISPSWLVDLVTTIKKKTPPLPHVQANQHQVVNPVLMDASHVQHRYIASNDSHQDPIVRPGLSHSQPVFTQSMTPLPPMSGPSLGPHTLHQVPTTAPGQPVSGPVQFTSESLPFHQQKVGPRTPSIVVNGADDQSELSDYSVSTSGCSSMIPHPDRKEYQREVLEMNESRIHQLRQELGGSVTPSKELEAKSRAEPSLSVSRGGEKSFLWSSEVKPKQNVPQPPAKRHKPSFNVSLFGASPINKDSDIHKEYQQSPFYPGKTTFGGASSHRKGRLKAKAPYQMAPTRKQVTARPSTSASGSAVTSSTAKRILDALDQMSSPLNDVKKIPSYNTSYANSPMSFTPSSYRRRPAGNVNRSMEFQGPPTQSLVTPSRVSIVPNLQRPGTGNNLIPKSKEPAKVNDNNMAGSSRHGGVGTHGPPGGLSGPLGGHSGKMKRERGGQHYSSKQAEEEEVEVPDLPTNFTLPVASMPNIDFSGGSGAAWGPQTTDRLRPVSPAFRFSSPIAGLGPDTSASSPISHKSFQFSSPLAVDKSSSARQNPSPAVSKSPAPATANFHMASPALTASPALAFNFNPAVAKRKETTTPTSAVPKNFKAALEGASGGGQDTSPGSLQAATELKSGSVMDILGGKKTTPTKSSSTTSGASKSLAALFQKPAGAWECPTCMLQNKPEAEKCPSCDTAKPKSGSSTSPPTSSNAVSLQSQATLPVSGGSLGSLFQKPVGAWECPTCMVQNQAQHSKCPACDTPKPSTAKLMGPPTTTPTTTLQSITVPSGTNSLASLFTKQAGSWDCPTCMVQNKAEHSKCPACDTPNPKAGNQAMVPVVPQQDIPKPTGPSLASLFKKPTGNWDCDTCMVTNKGEATKCIACEMPKPGMKATTSFKSPGGFNVGPSGGPGFGNSLKPKSDNTSVSENKPPASGFSFGTSISSSSSASGVFKTGVSDSKKTDLGLPGGGFKFGGTAVKSSDDTSDNNNKTGFGGYKFGQSKDSASDSTAVVKPTTETAPTGLGVNKSGQVSSSDSDKAVVNKPAKVGGFKFGQSVADSTSSNKTEASSTGGFKFGQTISTGPSKPGNVSSGPGGFKFGTTIASATKDNDNSSKTITTKEQSVAAPGFSFGTASSNAELPVKAVVPEKPKSEAPKTVFGAAGGAPVFGASTKPAEITATPSSASGFGTFGSKTNNVSSSNSTSLPPSTFVFGAKPAQAGGQKPGATGAALSTTSKPDSQAPPSGLFTFGQGAKMTPASTTGAGTFGGLKPTDSQPVFGSSLGTNKSVPSSLPPSSAGLFAFNPKQPVSKTTAPVFGQKRSEPDSADQGPAKRVKEASFPKSQSTPAFGTGAGPGPFGSAGNPPAFNATGANPAPPAFGSGVFSGAQAPSSFPSNPSFQFGANSGQPQGGVFQFGGAPKSEAPAAAPGFAFGQAAKPTPPTQTTPAPGYNFNSNATANFNFGAGNTPQPAPSFGGGNTAQPAPNFGGGNTAQPAPSFGAGAGTPQAPGGPFQFGGPPVDTSNPFSAAAVPGKNRQIKKAVRKLRK